MTDLWWLGESPELQRRHHANRHVGSFLKIPSDQNHTIIQVLHDGEQLTADRLLDSHCPLTLRRPILVQDTAESLGMIVPSALTTVRDVADVIGHSHPVSVIDVEHQEEKEGWSLGDLVDYFEDDVRLKQRRVSVDEEREREPSEEETSTAPVETQRRRRRKAAEKCRQFTDQQGPRVLNQISLEFSDTPLRDRVLSPRFVREMDWIDLAWPRKTKKNAKDPDHDPLLEESGGVEDAYPRVQYYCLTSAAGCYTDFHVDFGGTSVWYHVLRGEKDFCLIPPTPEHLAIYEEWLCRPNQAEIFLPDLIPHPETNVLRVSLKEGQTLVIPTAWIHGVYTPTDSLVLGGNFLHGIDLPLQLAVHGVECRARVPEKFRFPHFLPIHFYAGGWYLDQLRRGAISPLEVDGLPVLIDALEEWWKVHKHSAQSDLSHVGPTVAKAALEAAHRNHCPTVEDFLDELRTEHRRVVQEGIVPNPQALLLLRRRMEDAPISSSSLGKTPKLRLSLKMTSVVGPPASHKEPTQEEAVLIREVATNAGTKKLQLSLKGETEEQTGLSTMGIVESDQTMGIDKRENGGFSDATPSTKFRITLSSSKIMMAKPIITKPKRPREDAEWIDEGGAAALLDDEWMPSSSSKNTNSRRSKSSPPMAKPATARSKAKPQTSRQRLMKRFR